MARGPRAQSAGRHSAGSPRGMGRVGLMRILNLRVGHAQRSHFRLSPFSDGGDNIGIPRKVIVLSVTECSIIEGLRRSA